MSSMYSQLNKYIHRVPECSSTIPERLDVVGNSFDVCHQEGFIEAVIDELHFGLQCKNQQAYYMFATVH